MSELYVYQNVRRNDKQQLYSPSPHLLMSHAPFCAVLPAILNSSCDRKTRFLTHRTQAYVLIWK
jgi:hypothetical protein